MLAHRLEESLVASFRLDLTRQVEKDNRIQRDDETVLGELARRDLQQRAVVDVGTEKDMSGLMPASHAPLIIGWNKKQKAAESDSVPNDCQWRAISRVLRQKSRCKPIRLAHDLALA